MGHDSQPCLASGGTSQAASRNWFTTMALKSSAALHICSVLLIVLFPGYWEWALGIIFSNYLLLTAGVMQPRSRLLGPNMIRLPGEAALRREISLTFDDGPDPDITPLILDQLDQFGAKASFFCIASKVSTYPELAREIVKRGHSLENHTYRHPYTFAFFWPCAITREINRAQDVIFSVTGITPGFFRAPMGFRPPFLAPALVRTGLCHVAWTRRGFDTFANEHEPVLYKLLKGIAPGDILLLHDGRPNRPIKNPHVILNVLPHLLEYLKKHNLKSVSLPAACSQAKS